MWYDNHMVRQISTDDEIAEAIPMAQNFSEVAENLKASRKRVREIAAERNLKCLGGRRLTHEKYNQDNVLRLRDKRVRNLALYVRRMCVFPYVCVKCGNDGDWQGEELVLELDHINGNPLDDRKENLRWLCPNCHSQTTTFRGRKRK